LARSRKEKDFFKGLISRRELLTFKVSKRFYDVGSPESLREFKKLIASAEVIN
jgi:NDP-sugar pyrophosphorylase family protein